MWPLIRKQILFASQKHEQIRSLKVSLCWATCQIPHITLHRESQDPSVLAILHDYRESSKSFAQNGEKVCGGAGGQGSHLCREHNRHHPKGDQAKRKSAVYHPAHQRSGRAVSSAATPPAGDGRGSVGGAESCR